MYKYVLILKDERKKFYDRFALFLFLLNIVGIVAILSTLETGKSFRNLPALISLALTIAATIIYLLCKPGRKKDLAFFLAVICIAACWVTLAWWWIGFVMAGLFLLYRISKKELKVMVHPGYIVYPAFPQRRFSWNELNNVILKDGLLTIDLKNNRIIQQYLDESRTTVNEKEFNDFCRENLQAKRS